MTAPEVPDPPAEMVAIDYATWIRAWVRDDASLYENEAVRLEAIAVMLLDLAARAQSTEDRICNELVPLEPWMAPEQWPQLHCNLEASHQGQHAFVRAACAQSPEDRPPIDAWVRRGYWIRVCRDCDGSGRYDEPDGTPHTCVLCKGSGEELVAMADDYQESSRGGA